MGVINADVLLNLDERSARAVTDQMEQQFRRSGEQASSAFSNSFSRNMQTSLTGQMQRTGRDAVGAFQREMDAGLRNVITGATSNFGALGRVADNALGGISTKAAAAAVGVGALVVGVGAAGKAMYDLGKQWDDIVDGITVRTGKVGTDLAKLRDVVGDVGGTTAASLGDIGNIVAQISQSMPDLAANNSAIRQMASNLAYLDANGQSVNIRELGMAFRAFNVDAADQVHTLDSLNHVSQQTGIPINQLIATVRTGAPQFKQFGLNIGEATGLIAAFNDAGLDSNATATGLRVALKNLGTDSRGAAPALAEVVAQIKALHDTGNEAGAQQLATEIFGGRNFAPFLDAIENGRLSVDGLNRALEGTGLSLQQMQDETDDGAQGFQKLTNTIKTDLGPWADRVFTFVNSQVKYMTGNFTDAKDALQGLASVPIDPNSALGKMLTPGGLPGSSTPGVATPGGIGNAIGGVPGHGLTLPGGLLAPQWGSHNIPNPPSDSRSGGGSSSAQVPYGALPAITPGVPMTPEVYSAQSSLWEAQHNAEEKRAELQRLEGANNTKADELVKARNDVAKAERDQHESEMRFQKVQQDAYESQFKQLKKAADQLGQVGAELDQDFGISDGLAGVVENITKALANLAMAPVIGALRGVQAANGFGPGEAGSGLSSVLANSGVFGARFVAQPGGSGSGGGYGGNYIPSALPIPTAGTTPGGSYGMPGGTNSGGYGGSGAQFPAWVNQVAQAFGIKPSTYPGHQESDRNEPGYAPNPLHQNRGIDWSGPTANLQRFADYLARNPGGLEQVIWQNPNTGQSTEIAGGRPQPGYFAGDLGGHRDHVHTRQSSPIPIPGGWGTPATASGSGGGGWGLPNTVAGSPGQGFPLPWTLGVGPGGSPGITGGPGWLGGPAAPGVGSAIGQGLGGQAAPSQSVAGGRQLGAGLGASAGFGIGGGLLGAAGNAITSAAGMAGMAGGMGMDGGAGGAVASAVAQIGVQEIQRAIGAAGQYAGNLVTGGLETFSLNDSPLADPGSSWFGRLAIAASGMRPALPNAAGTMGGGQNPNMLEGGKQPPGPLSPEQAQMGAAAKGQGQGDTTNNTTNINVTNNRATEDGTGKDIQAHLGAQAMATAPR